MNFKKATDELLASVTLADLAEALGVSVQAVRQARAAAGSSAHRTAPQNWQAGVIKVASRRAGRLDRLINALNHQQKN